MRLSRLFAVVVLALALPFPGAADPLVPAKRFQVWNNTDLPKGDLLPFAAENDLLALTVPTDLGGGGLPLSDGISVTYDLARRSGSAGLTYAMHLAQIHTWAAHVKGSVYLADELRALIATRRLVASVVSEPETGGNIHKATAALGADALHKDTSNTSYVPGAGAFLVTAMDASGAKPVQRLVMIRGEFICFRTRSHPEMPLQRPASDSL